MYNVILIADISYAYTLSRSYGIHRIASEMRDLGYSVLCLNYCSSMSKEMFTEIVDLAIGSETIFVGISTTWFPYIDPNKKILNNGRSIIFYGENHYKAQSDNRWFFEGFSWGFTNGEGSKSWVDIIHAKNPNTKIVVGGTRAHQYIDDSNIDHIFIGSSETMLIEFLTNIKNNKELLRVYDYDRTADNRDIWDFRNSSTQYSEEDFILPSEYLSIEFSRGCKFKCAYCSWPFIGRARPKEYTKYQDVIRNELLENYKKWGITKYLIVDDTFNDSTEKLVLIKEVIDSLPFKPKFWAYVRIDLIASHPEQAQLILDIGVKEINWGMETLNDETGKIINKGNAERKKKGLIHARSIWKDEIYLTANLIVGLPKEDFKSVEKSVDWFVNEGRMYIDFFDLFPLVILEKNEYRYSPASLIEANPEKYGYKVIDGMNWIREDGSTRTEWVEFAKEQKNRSIKHNKLWRNAFYRSILEPIDSFFNYDNLKNYPEEQFNKEIKDRGDITNLYYKYVNTVYWPRLMEYLKANAS